MKHSVILLIIILFSFTGCIKVLNDDLKSEKTKLVVNGVISPDTIISLNVSHTFNIFDAEINENMPFIDNATVKFYQDGEYLFDLENQDTGYYTKNFYPQTGKQYSITVSAPDYDDVSAETKIPLAVKIVKFDTTTTFYYEYDTKYMKLNADLTYNDPPGEENYYMLTGQYHLFYEQGDINETVELDLTVPEGEAELFDNAYGSYLLWSDKLINGQEVTIHFSYLQWYMGYGNGKEPLNMTFTFYFKSVSKDYYFYLKTLSLYHETNNIDPFMEPVVIYSNIKNGYGIFGSYNMDSAVIEKEIVDGINKEGGRP